MDEYRRQNHRQSTSRTSSVRPTGQARTRAMARRRKRLRQRRLILCGLFLVVVLLIGGIGFGIANFRNTREKQAFAAAGIEAMDQGNYEAAIENFDLALERSKGKIRTFEENVLLYRAEAEYRLEDFTAARNTYELLLAENPDNEIHQKGMVLCLIEQGDYEAALNLGVWQGAVYNRMAAEQIKAGQYDLALDTIARGKAVADDALRGELVYNEAVAWEYKGDYAKALELFESYVSQYGTSESAQREIVFLKSRQGNQE